MTLSGGSWGRVVEAELTQGPTSTRPGHSVTGPGKKSNFKINTFLRPSQQCQNQTTLTTRPILTTELTQEPVAGVMA